MIGIKSKNPRVLDLSVKQKKKKYSLVKDLAEESRKIWVQIAGMCGCFVTCVQAEDVILRDPTRHERHERDRSFLGKDQEVTFWVSSRRRRSRMKETRNNRI